LLARVTTPNNFWLSSRLKSVESLEKKKKENLRARHVFTSVTVSVSVNVNVTFWGFHSPPPADRRIKKCCRVWRVWCVKVLVVLLVYCFVLFSSQIPQMAATINRVT
jgi:hypothetical protein